MQVWGFCTCSANGAFVFHPLSETMVANLSFLIPVLYKLQEVGKGKKRENTGGGRRKDISPISRKKYISSSLKREREEFLSLWRKMKGILYTA